MFVHLLKKGRSIMFTGAHLAVFIMNLLIPLFWIPLIIKHIVSYFQLKTYYAERDTKIKMLKEDIPPLRDDMTDEVRDQSINAKIHADLLLVDHQANLKHAFYMMFFWTAIGVGMTLCATADAIEVAVKLYHSECPCTLSRPKQVQSSDLQPTTTEQEKKND